MLAQGLLQLQGITEHVQPVAETGQLLDQVIIHFTLARPQEQAMTLPQWRAGHRALRRGRHAGQLRHQRQLLAQAQDVVLSAAALQPGAQLGGQFVVGAQQLVGTRLLGHALQTLAQRSKAAGQLRVPAIQQLAANVVHFLGQAQQGLRKCLNRHG